MLDLVSYCGALLYPVGDRYEAEYNGFHFDASNIEELKAKLDFVIKNDKFKLNPNNHTSDIPLFCILSEDGTTEFKNRWIVQYQLIPTEIDDDMQDSSIKEIIIQAPDIDSVTKYAHQYIRKMQKDPDVVENWDDAEIISITEQ